MKLIQNSKTVLLACMKSTFYDCSFFSFALSSSLRSSGKDIFFFCQSLPIQSTVILCLNAMFKQYGYILLGVKQRIKLKRRALKMIAAIQNSSRKAQNYHLLLAYVSSSSPDSSFVVLKTITIAFIVRYTCPMTSMTRYYERLLDQAQPCLFVRRCTAESPW